MGNPLTDYPFSQPRLTGGTNGSIGQGSSSLNSGPGAISYYGPGSFTTATAIVGTYAGIHAPTFDHKPTPHEGIRLGEIEAWRAWCVRNGFLTSVTAELIWAPGEAVYGDVREYGIHAFKTASEAMTYVSGWGGLMIVGKVALWGEVVEHESGYRAEYARPMSLEFVVEGNIPESKLNAIRKTYGFETKTPEAPSIIPRVKRFWRR